MSKTANVFYKEADKNSKAIYGKCHKISNTKIHTDPDKRVYHNNIVSYFSMKIYVVRASPRRF